MYENSQVIAFIPARGGSKGIHEKNLQVLGERPLIQWSYDFAKKMNIFDKIVVSSDNKKILDTAENLGASLHHRPGSLSEDGSRVIDAIRHYLKTLSLGDGTILVLLECTSPFRKCDQLKKGLDLIVGGGYDSVASFNKLHVPRERIWNIDQKESPTTILKGVDPWLPRQQLTPAYVLNGNFYAFNANMLPENSTSLLFGRVGAVIIDACQVIDIDDYQDLKMANAMTQKGLIDHD